MSAALHRTARGLLALLLAGGVAACHRSPAAPSPDAGAPGADGGGDGGAPDGGSQAGGDGGSSADAGVPVVVRAIFPAQGPAEGGTAVLVTGAGFVEGFAARGGGAVSQVTEVRVGGALATDVDVIDDNRLQLTVPAGAAGAADLAVKNPNGTGTCAGCFRYLARVEIDAIEPARGPPGGGTAVTVRGRGFVPGMLITLGGAELIGLQVSGDGQATGLTPPGAAGPAELVCATRDGLARARSAFVYQDALAALAVVPRTTDAAGGAALLVQGRGFGPRAQVLLGGAAQATRWIDDRQLSLVAPAHDPGPVEVAVADPDALPSEDDPAAAPPRSALAAGLVFTGGAGAPGALSLAALSPRHGPLAGGSCPQACLRLTGSGLSLPDLVVTVAGAPVAAGAVHAEGDLAASIDLPPGAQPGPVDLAVSSAAQGTQAVIAAADPGAFRYDPPLAIAQVQPAQGPASGSPAVQLAITGTGFDQSPGAPLLVTVGALPAGAVQVAPGGGSLTATAPAGAPGPADVVITATDADGTRRAARAAGAFSFTAPLALLQVQPASGAQSGGAQVSLLGRGFAAGAAVSFGGRSASGISLASQSELRCTLPPGNPGAVAVAVQQGAAQDQLAAGFTYFDPQSNAGGSGGGPLLGALNVTVIDSTAYVDGNVAGATVDVVFEDGAALRKLTDARGQVTFADPRLVLPVQVTAWKPTYDAITVVAHQTANLTVFLRGPPPPPPPPPDPPPPPPPAPQQATVGGHVYGFKPPPGLVLTANQRLVAYVRTTYSSIYGAPPFSPPATPLVVDHDGGSWSFQTTRLSPVTLTAEYGVEETLGQNLTRFTPILLGVRRGVQPNPDKPLTDADLILDTHLDRQADASFTGLPSPTPGNPLLHEAGVLLDLGSSGLVALSSVRDATGSQISFPRLPAASGQGFVFVDEVISGRAVSVYLRRIFGDVLGGLTLGPYLPFPIAGAPPDLAPLPAGFDGTFSWSVSTAGLAPNLLQLQLDGQDVSWTVVLPGDARKVKLPAELLAKLKSGNNYYWTLEASLAPGFDYAYWNYYDLYGGSWTSYAYDNAQFTVP